MSADRFFQAQDGHTVMLLPPQNITGGVHSAAFNFKNYKHASLNILFGALGAEPGAITVEACTAQAGTGATAIPFNIYPQETNGGDALGAVVACTSSGYTPPASLSNINYVIEIDSAAIPNSNTTTGASLGLNYLRVSIADGSNTDYAAILAVLSGARYAGDQSPTVLV